MNKPFRRIGSRSNAQAGRDFELAAQRFLESIGLSLDRNVRIPVGIGAITKDHAFDLGSLSRKVIVECKCHRWTTSDNMPSAKLTVWNEAMYYFVAAPRDYRKILFVLRDYSPKRDETLAEYYLRTYSYLIPSDVELWEYDEESRSARRLAPDANLSPTHTTGKPMNRQVEIERDPDMLDDYDFSQGVRGKYVEQFAHGSNVVVLSPDVAAIFPDSESVNSALRMLVEIAGKSSGKAPVH